jgi:hypothetical protein
MAVQTPQQAKDEAPILAAKPGIPFRKVQVYVEPKVYLEFWVHEDFYNYFEVTP